VLVKYVNINKQFDMMHALLRYVLLLVVVSLSVATARPLPGLRRGLSGLFNGWQKDVSKPSYSAETTHYGIGGETTVQKTQVHSGTFQDSDGNKISTEAVYKGKASGSEGDAQVNIDVANCDDNSATSACLKSNVQAVGTDVSASTNQKMEFSGSAGDTSVSSVDATGNSSSEDGSPVSATIDATTAVAGPPSQAGVFGSVNVTGPNASSNLDTQATATAGK
jgi:hypothetical protein